MLQKVGWRDGNEEWCQGRMLGELAHYPLAGAPRARMNGKGILGRGTNLYKDET